MWFPSVIGSLDFSSLHSRTRRGRRPPTRKLCLEALEDRTLMSAVHPLFDLAALTTSPFPTDRFTVADTSQNTGRRVNLPLPDLITHPSDYEDTQVLNTLDGALPAVQRVAPGVVGHRLQPAAEAARGVIGKGPHSGDQFGEHLLGYILGVGLLEAPLSAPGVDAGAVAEHERTPGRPIRGVLAQPAEQRGAGRRRMGAVHKCYPPRGRDLAPILA